MKKMKMPKIYAQTVIIVVSVVFLLGILAFFACRKEMFSSKPTITYYFLPSCGWCTKFNPEWEKFVKMAPDTIVTNKVDGTTSPEIEKYKIKSFPHVQIVNEGIVTVFEGERTAENLMKFVKGTTSNIETFFVEDPSPQIGINYPQPPPPNINNPQPLPPNINYPPPPPNINYPPKKPLPPVCHDATIRVCMPTPRY